jgi:hypothetical protein
MNGSPGREPRYPMLILAGSVGLGPSPIGPAAGVR